MKLDFPLISVNIEVVNELTASITNSIYSTPRLDISEMDFLMKVDHVACYHVQNGNKIQILPCREIDQASVQLFLNGSVLGAVLHQQGVIPLHGSSIEYEGKGIIICGNSGVGKSSVTAAFCKNGAHFINDDITPIGFDESGANILPIRTKMKLWNDTLKTLEIKNENLEKIRPSLEKFYVPFFSKSKSKQPLNTIVILCVHNDKEYKVVKLTGIDKYNLIRKNIYRKIYLRGMPQTERNYFQKLLKLAETIDVIQVFRPKICNINSTMNYIHKQLLA